MSTCSTIGIYKYGRKYKSNFVFPLSSVQPIAAEKIKVNCITWFRCIIQCHRDCSRCDCFVRIQCTVDCSADTFLIFVRSEVDHKHPYTQHCWKLLQVQVIQLVENVQVMFAAQLNRWHCFTQMMVLTRCSNVSSTKTELRSRTTKIRPVVIDVRTDAQIYGNFRTGVGCYLLSCNRLVSVVNWVDG